MNCHHNVAQLRRLREQFPNELVVIGVHSGKFTAEKSIANVRQAVMRHGIRHPVINDADFTVWKNYAVRAWPTLVLVDPAGKVVDTQSGEILAEEYAPKIQALVEKFEQAQLLKRTPPALQPETGAEPARPLNYPSKLLLNQERLFIADTGHHRILEVQLAADGQSGQIVRVFGRGQPGFKDGPAADAMFHDPHGMALSGDTLFVADTENHAIRAIDLADSSVRTVAGTGQKAHGPAAEGSPTETALRSPWALWTDKNILLIAMAGAHQIWALVGDERLGVFAGNGREALIDGPLTEASFNQPSDLDVGFGHLFIADSEASAIRAISMGPDPLAMTLVGQGLFEFGDVDGLGGLVRLQHPAGLAFYNELIYIADSYNHKIKMLDPTTGEVQTLIGTGQPGSADGSFAQAQLFEPEGVVAGNGYLYIADTNNHLIRVANLAAGTLHTLRLHGLAQLQASTPPARAGEPVRLAPHTVAPGQVAVTLELKLPAGYKLNADAPQTVQVFGNSAARTEYTFKAAETPAFTTTVTTDCELEVELTLYYCQTADERLCMIHNVRLALPLAISNDGREQVQALYRVAL